MFFFVVEVVAYVVVGIQQVLAAAFLPLAAKRSSGFCVVNVFAQVLFTDFVVQASVIGEEGIPSS